MASVPGPLTAEQQRDLLFRDGLSLREQIVAELRNAHALHAGPKEVVTRARLREVEGRSQQLMDEYLRYEARVSHFVEGLATAQQVNGQPVTLNWRFQFAIYISELSSHRETIRAILGELDESVAAHRANVDARFGQYLNGIFLVLAVASLYVALRSFWDTREAGKQQAISAGHQQSTLDESRRALESIVSKVQEQQQTLEAARKALDASVAITQAQQGILQKNLRTSEEQLAIIQEQRRREMERADVHLSLFYTSDFAIAVTNKGKKVARDTLYQGAFWNLDRPRPPRFQLVSCKTEEVKYIRPGASFLPTRVDFRFSNDKSPLQNGNRLFGYVTAQCPDCMKERIWWVYFTVGGEGWYVEGEWEDYPFMNLTPESAESVVSKMLSQKGLMPIPSQLSGP